MCLGGQLFLDTTIHEMNKAGQSGTAVRHLACGTFGLGVCAAKIASGRPVVSPSFTILIDHKNDGTLNNDFDNPSNPHQFPAQIKDWCAHGIPWLSASVIKCPDFALFAGGFDLLGSF